MLNFRFFNMENENLGFLARRQNVAQSTVLREYLLKMPKLFQIGPIVIKNGPSKVGRKSKNHQKSMKFCQEMLQNQPKCVQNVLKKCAQSFK